MRRIGALEDGDGAAGLERSLNLEQADFVVGEVAKAEGGGHKIKRSVGERETQCIGLDKPDWTELHQIRTMQAGAFFFRAQKHAVCKIHADQSRPISAG